LTNLFDNDDKEVRAAAMEVCTRRVYRTYDIPAFDVAAVDGRLSCSFEFQLADVPGEFFVALLIQSFNITASLTHPSLLQPL